MQTDEKISSKPPSIPETESLESRAQAFADVYNRVTSHPAVFAAIERKHLEAMLVWAFWKMGPKRVSIPWKLAGTLLFFALCAYWRRIETSKMSRMSFLL